MHEVVGLEMAMLLEECLWVNLVIQVLDSQSMGVIVQTVITRM
jgi:hypothetical protein